MATNPNIDDGRFTWSRSPVYRFQKGITRWTEYNDPTYLTFVFMFDWTSPLLDTSDKVGTAYSYLKRNGENLRAEYLKLFIETLKSINVEMPWYWQSFEGGENLWKYNNFTDPYKGGDDSVINIECLESIDLKVTMLMDLYRKAIYDQEHKRIMVPENLRKFEMYIWIQEVRKFQIKKYVENKSGITTNGQTSNLGNGEQSDYELGKNENSPYIWFRLRFCEFDADAASTPLATLSAMHGDSSGFAKQKISIKYELVEEPGNFYPWLNSTISSTDTNIPSNNDTNDNKNKFEDAGRESERSDLQKRYDSARQKVTDKGKELSEDYQERARKAGERYKENVFGEAENFIQGRVQRILLGNVYGTGNTVIQTLEQGSVQSLGTSIINAVANENNNNQGPSDLGNVYG